MNFKNATLLPQWGNTDPELARDMLHPGPIQHFNWAEEIKPYII